MGIFSYVKGDSKPQDEVPLRSKRELCWSARDLFNSCLDKNSVENPLDPQQIKIVNSKCHQQDLKFQQDCAKSWVQYFKEKRYIDIKKEKMLNQIELENAKLIQLPTNK